MRKVRPKIKSGDSALRLCFAPNTKTAIINMVAYSVAHKYPRRNAIFVAHRGHFARARRTILRRAESVYRLLCRPCAVDLLGDRIQCESDLDAPAPLWAQRMAQVSSKIVPIQALCDPQFGSGSSSRSIGCFHRQLSSTWIGSQEDPDRFRSVLRCAVGKLGDNQR